MPVLIYDIPKVINLVLPESTGSSGTIHMNYPANRTDFRLIRGVTNQIQFFVRDIDRKFVNLTGEIVTINITDVSGTVLLLSRVLTVTDITQALLMLTVTPSDMRNWANGSLKYSLTVTRTDGMNVLLWTDQNYGPYSFLSVEEGPIPTPAAPLSLDPTTFLVTDGWAISGPLPSSAQLAYPSGSQTFSIYTSAYTGLVKIQGSLDVQPSSDPANWFDITSQTFTAINGVTGITTQGNFLWLRFLATITQNGYNPPLPWVSTSGTINRILYKN